MKMAPNAVGEAFFSTNAHHQAGGKASAPKNIIHEAQGEKIRIVARQPQMATAYLTLGESRLVQ